MNTDVFNIKLLYLEFGKFEDIFNIGKYFKIFFYWFFRDYYVMRFGVFIVFRR